MGQVVVVVVLLVVASQPRTKGDKILRLEWAHDQPVATRSWVECIAVAKLADRPSERGHRSRAERSRLAPWRRELALAQGRDGWAREIEHTRRARILGRISRSNVMPGRPIAGCERVRAPRIASHACHHGQ